MGRPRVQKSAFCISRIKRFFDEAPAELLLAVAESIDRNVLLRSSIAEDGARPTLNRYLTCRGDDIGSDGKFGGEGDRQLDGGSPGGAGARAGAQPAPGRRQRCILILGARRELARTARR